MTALHLLATPRDLTPLGYPWQVAKRFLPAMTH